MRYVVLNKKMDEKEKKSRKNYIEKVTNLYFIPFEFDGGIEYISIPYSINDCLFIVGHNKDVNYYLLKSYIQESNIVIVSCYFSINAELKNSKSIFVSYDNEGLTNYYDGKDWNLQFLISKPELKLINSSGLFIDRVKKYFRRVNDGKNSRKDG